MAGSFSRELEDLLNPLPKFADPEDGDDDEATKARVIDRLDEEDDEEEEDVRGALRARSTSLLSETDRRYAGRRVSRKQLLMDMEGPGEEDDEEGAEGSSLGENEEDDSVEEEEEEEEEGSSSSEGQPGAELMCKAKGADVIFPPGVDFHRLTEGMDDLGVSEDDEDGEETEGSDEGDGSDGDEMDGDDDDEEEDEDAEEEAAVRTFSQEKVDEEVEKGKCVKNQLALWDQLLEGRIKIQKALVTANQLPQPHTLPEFRRRGGAELAGAQKNTHKALKALQRSLLELHDQLLYQNPDTRAVAVGRGGAQDQDDEINSEEGEDEGGPPEASGAPKRKLDMAEYPAFMAKRFSAFQPYSEATLQRWHDKTRLTTGKGGGGGGGWGAFDRSITAQVEQVLMDKERLLRRTQTRRSEYRVLGRAEAPRSVCTEGGGAEQQLKANAHLKDVDEDVFDDDDFYHQLLRELIERRTSVAAAGDPLAMGRQWLAIQKLRSKIKKKVDTKASKGRKVRFHVHSKLVNFMAPVEHSGMTEEARSELYRSLFTQSL